MAINIVAYAFVDPKGPPPTCAVQQVPPGIHEYFERHVDTILGQAKQGSISPAQFRPQKAKQRFARLRQGTEAEFLQSAQELVDRLAGATDKRMNRGFFVALRRTGRGPAQSVVLKLDVYDEPAARLKQTTPGDAFFEEVKDLLDIPGDLHKGAVYPDPRADSDLAVVDRFETHYFLKALEVEQVLSGYEATRTLVEVIDSVTPAALENAVAAMRKREEPFFPEDFVQEEAGVFSKEGSAALVAALTALPRPIGLVNPVAHPVRQGIVKANGFKITGPADLIDKEVLWGPHLGRFRITIDVNGEPKKTYK
jgi:hypothetical protein